MNEEDEEGIDSIRSDVPLNTYVPSVACEQLNSKRWQEIKSLCNLLHIFFLSMLPKSDKFYDNAKISNISPAEIMQLFGEMA
jgi:hypothetical protein